MKLQLKTEEDFEKLLELAGKHYNTNIGVVNAAALKQEYILYKRAMKVKGIFKEIEK